MSKPLVVITGKNGQLGFELSVLSLSYENEFDFLFTNRHQLDLNIPESIPVFFEKYSPKYFINCAAYTAVDKAETEQEQALLINATSLGIISVQCHKYNCTLISISTDYVFSGQGNKPYLPEDTTSPINYYGYTKWMGEQLALQNNKHTLIIRTSWLYSSHGNNFVKTMIRLMKEKAEISVVNDQMGSPTFAGDLANAICKILLANKNGNDHYGIYHFSNDAVISWYEFAIAIRDFMKLTCDVLPMPSTDYPTPAKRPTYSVMNTHKLSDDFAIDIIPWRDSLQKCLNILLT